MKLTPDQLKFGIALLALLVAAGVPLPGKAAPATTEDDAPVEDDAPAEDAAAEDAPAEEEAADPYEEIRNVLKKVVEKHGKDHAKAVLAKHKAKLITDIPEAKLPKALVDAKAALKNGPDESMG